MITKRKDNILNLKFHKTHYMVEGVTKYKNLRMLSNYNMIEVFST